MVIIGGGGGGRRVGEARLDGLSTENAAPMWVLQLKPLTAVRRRKGQRSGRLVMRTPGQRAELATGKKRATAQGMC